MEDGGWRTEEGHGGQLFERVGLESVLWQLGKSECTRRSGRREVPGDVTHGDGPRMPQTGLRPEPKT
jgi:hypothetical protein